MATTRLQTLLPELVGKLAAVDPCGYAQWQFSAPFGIIPPHALENGQAEWWTTDAPLVLEQLQEAIAAAGEGEQ